jgi:glycosyltransferase involved in cell wall biosynthesis
VAEGLIRNGLSPDRVTLVHDGVPDRLLAVQGEVLARELRLPLGSRVIGNIAALTEHKDHDTLLTAMRRVLQVVPDALLLIVGEGPLRSRLESEARKQGLGERCVFTGFRSDVDRLMSCFSVFSLTSRLEGLGTTLLDAMCVSRPVVATATGGIPEAVRHGETGLLVPVGDSESLAAALVDLLTDETSRLAMGQAGRRLFEQRFTAARMVEGTLRVYDEVCGSLALEPAAQGLGTATVPLQSPLGRLRYSSRNLRASSKASPGTIVPRTLG